MMKGLLLLQCVCAWWGKYIISWVSFKAPRLTGTGEQERGWKSSETGAEKEVKALVWFCEEA